MTPQEIIAVLEVYEKRLEEEGVAKHAMPPDVCFGSVSHEEILSHAYYLCDGVRDYLKSQDTMAKANRHFAAIQMCLSFACWYTLEELMSHNRPGPIPMSSPQRFVKGVTDFREPNGMT